MKRPSKKAPNRWADQKHHNKFGIWNYLESKGISDAQEKHDIIKAFLEREGFKCNNGDQEKKRNSFISNRFSKFVKFVNNTSPQVISIETNN